MQAPPRFVLLALALGGAMLAALPTRARADLPTSALAPADTEGALAPCENEAAGVDDDAPDAVRARCVHDVARDLLDAVNNASALLADYRTATQEFCWSRIMAPHIRATGDDGAPYCVLHPEQEYTPTDDDYAWVASCTVAQERTLVAVALRYALHEPDLADRLVPAPTGATGTARDDLVADLTSLDECLPEAKKRLDLFRTGVVKLCEAVAQGQESSPMVGACTDEIGMRAAAAWFTPAVSHP